MKDKAVLYFSRDGSTRIVAGLIAEKLDAELIELRPEKERRSFLLSGFKAATKKHVSLAGDPWGAIRENNLVALGSPIWAGNGNPVMNGFLDKADLTDKRVLLFTVQADPGKAKSEQVLAHFSRRVEEAGGTVVSSRAFVGASPGRTAAEDALKEQLAGWDLPV